MSQQILVLDGEEAIGCLRIRPHGWLIRNWEDMSGREVTLFREEDPKEAVKFRFSNGATLGVVCTPEEDGSKLATLADHSGHILTWVRLRLLDDAHNKALSELFDPEPEGAPTGRPSAHTVTRQYDRRGFAPPIVADTWGSVLGT